MLTRQKILVAMLSAAQRPVNRMELMKWAFLMRQTAEESAGSGCYDFVPYHYGPFSFAMYQEIGKLEQQGYVKQQGESHWQLGTETAPRVPDGRLRIAAEGIVHQYGNLPLDDLLDTVYDRFPAFTVNSRRRKLASRIEAPIAVYTSGYEGLSVDAFLNRLVQTGIRHVADVRRNPIARRYGFHKSTLKRLCESLDIRYSHVPELGIASEDRQELHTQADRDRLFRRYSATTLGTELKSIAQLSQMVLESPTVLVCIEAEPCACHRSHLAMTLAGRTNLEIKHLV